MIFEKKILIFLIAFSSQYLSARYFQSHQETYGQTNTLALYENYNQSILLLKVVGGVLDVCLPGRGGAQRGGDRGAHGADAGALARHVPHHLQPHAGRRCPGTAKVRKGESL